jgi:enoyl-CoA hydratase/carnithine racemase
MLHQNLDPSSGIMTLALSRPPVNALDPALYDSLHEGLAFAAHHQDVKAVVLTSQGQKAFCAGADIKALAHLPPHEAEQKQLALILRCLQDWVKFSKPTVAAIDAPAIGAGLMLACACDEIVMADSAWVSMPEIQLGLPTPIGACILQRRLRHLAVHALVQRAEKFDAKRSYEQGLVDVLASSVELPRVANQRAADLAKLDTEVYAINKQWTSRGLLDLLASAAAMVEHHE